MLDVHISKENNLGVIKLKGELDIATVENFNNAVGKAKGVSQGVIFDFSDLQFLDSTGVGSLLQAIRSLQQEGLSVEICNIHEEVYEVLDLLGIPELVGEELFENAK